MPNHRSLHNDVLDKPEYRILSKDAKHTLLALKFSRIGNYGGIFVLARGELLTLSEQTSISETGLKKAIAELNETKWVIVEEPMIWLKGLGLEDWFSFNCSKHIAGLEKNIIKSLPNYPLVAKYCEYHKLATPFEAPSDALPTPLVSTSTLTLTSTSTLTKKNNNKDIVKKETEPLLLPIDSFEKWLKQNRDKYIKMVQVKRKAPDYDGMSKFDPNDKWARDKIQEIRMWILANTDTVDEKAYGRGKGGVKQNKDWNKFVANWLSKDYTNTVSHPSQMSIDQENDYYNAKRRSGTENDGFTAIGEK